MVKVSIIVPIYNSEKYLKKCLDSLVEQTLNDIEFILINDGSTDKSDEIIKNYKDKRIKYYKRTNHGIGATRNFGIDQASGKYIGFVDSDDYVNKDMYLKMYEKCKENNLDIVVCDYIKEEENKKEIIKFSNFNITDLNNHPDLLTEINLAPWNKIYKKSLFDEKTYYPINVKYEDTPFVALMLSKAKKIGKINDPLYHYTVHNNSQTTIIDNKVYDIFKICDILLKDLSKNKKIESSVYDLIIYLITTYTISQRYIKEKKSRNKFIDKAFIYLKENIPNYKKSNYFKKRHILKKIIEKNKTLTKMYCNMYAMLKK